jgi:hypothetical protein
MDHEPFALQRPHPKPRVTQFVSHGGTQKVLFSGMDCLPGQQDLFPTDGVVRDDNKTDVRDVPVLGQAHGE